MAAPEDREIDAHSGQATTGHEWDGIKELDTPLPRWWLYIFYASIAAAVIYWVLMPAWPLVNGYTQGLLNFSDRRNVAADVRALQTARAPLLERLQRTRPEEIVADPQLREFAFAAGEAVFGDNCRTCHGAGGAGAPGFPSLADDVWLWGGTLEDIEQTIRTGIRSGHADARMSQMPAFGRDQMLTRAQIGDVTEYVLSLGPARARTNPNPQGAARGAAIYAQQCAACHGATGQGDRTQGAPSLTDDVWLYGGSREEVRRQIEQGRNGVMPNWDRRFDAATIRALAIYVYALGGGEPTPAPPAPAPAESEAAPAQ
ncbi:MAG: cytochrome-c oxidase, cbb3-type subunit III [Hyphomonadaceae bacterium]